MYTPPTDLPTLVPLTPSEEKVLVQTLQFEAALPALMAEHANRWVVWLDGLRSVHATKAAARAWAAEHLEAGCGRVIARVAERKPVSLSGMSAFRFRP